MAILVQPIRDAITSGIGEIESDTIHIYSSWGLGFSLVKGEVEPDYYQIQRSTGMISKKLGNKIISYKVMINLDLQSYPRDQILVTKGITPDWLNLLRHSKGIITEEGGMTSHAAILARELGIPAVVAAKNATRLINSGDTILIRGSSGEIYQVPNNTKLQLRSPYSPPSYNWFNYPIATKLLVNLSQASSLTDVSNLPIDGVGLLRAELMLLELLSSHHLSNLTETKNRLFVQEKFTDSRLMRPNCAKSGKALLGKGLISKVDELLKIFAQ